MSVPLVMIADPQMALKEATGVLPDATWKVDFGITLDAADVSRPQTVSVDHAQGTMNIFGATYPVSRGGCVPTDRKIIDMIMSADLKDFEMKQEAALRRELEEQQRPYERAETGVSHSYGESYFANFPISVRGGTSLRVS